jgi:hypothetical protein
MSSTPPSEHGFSGERFWTWSRFPGVYMDEDAWAWMLDHRHRIEVAIKVGASRAARRDLESCMSRLTRYDHVVLRGRGLVAAYTAGRGLSPVRRGDLQRAGLLAYLGPDQIDAFTFRERWWALTWE